MRPRFRELLSFPPPEAVRRLRAHEADSGHCQLTVLGRHVEVRIREAEHHLWSPQLTLELDDAEQGSELHGLFGPNPGIWTTFVAAYGFVGLSMFFGGLFGLSQQVAGQSAWGLWILPVGAVCLVGIYLGSLYGQRLAGDQMRQLVDFLHAALEVDANAPERPAPGPSSAAQG
ncbi:MAG: hypothetical protein R3F62_27795 [Planctomycetota bacterium]